MDTISLRFSDGFAPEEGTISAHQRMIVDIGFVWYGKLGASVSDKVISSLLSMQLPKILLINSGSSKRYWAHIADVKRSIPEENEYPSYYRDKADRMKTWFKVVMFEEAPKDVMSHCKVKSSGALLSTASRHSMSPYFIIEYDGE